mgnify:CR=1 FL=1
MGRVKIATLRRGRAAERERQRLALDRRGRGDRLARERRREHRLPGTAHPDDGRPPALRREVAEFDSQEEQTDLLQRRQRHPCQIA